ncbi:MAG: hypothetical protein DMF72_08605 [Acidobacteria bacterium]|nr:MAG: hypothetical protein DMF72_08605 [Acidobacteriota bacterium]
MKYLKTPGISRVFPAALISIFIFGGSFRAANAQTDNSPFPPATDLQQGAPLTNQEFVRLLYQLPMHPEQRGQLEDQIRKRGIGFPITPGLRSLIATKSGNDASLIHTLEEADRRRANPTVATLPPIAEATELLERTRKATLGAAETMPDYLVKQNIIRSHAFGQSKNWAAYDRLSIAVSYRQSAGEDYKLLTVNGIPASEDQSYGMKLGGTISTGEYVTALTELFKPESRAEFTPVDTDTLRGRRTIIYEYEVKKEFSRQSLGWGEGGSIKQQTISGYRGRIWIDRETNRVLRLEDISTEIDSGFPITAASKVIDYDWVSINEQQRLLPAHAVVELTDRYRGQTEQTRNEILFRGYRKFGAEVKIIDIDEKDFPPDKPEDEPKKPETPPVLKQAPPKKP